MDRVRAAEARDLSIEQSCDFCVASSHISNSICSPERFWTLGEFGDSIFDRNISNIRDE